MAAAEGEGTEVSVANAYCVVYRLEKSEWVVTGEGWAQVHLYRDTSDGTYRLVGWTVQDYNVVCNCNVTATCKYKKKSGDFHKFTDEDDNVFGFGFYKKEESLEESEKFMHTICKTIEELIRGAGPSAPAAPQAPTTLPPPSAPASTSAKPGSSIAARSAALGGIKFGAAPPALTTQGSFRDNTPAAPTPPSGAPPSSSGAKPKPPALPAHNHAHNSAAAGGSAVTSPATTPTGARASVSGKAIPGPPAPRKSVATADNLPANGSAGGVTPGKPRPPPLGKAQSVATPGGPKPPTTAAPGSVKGPAPPSAAGTALAPAPPSNDSKSGAPDGSGMSAKQSQMAKMEELAVEPKTHRTASIAMDMIYENKQVPLGKLKILPPKNAKKYADTSTRPIITDPYGIIHTQHVKYNASTRSYQGLPPEWESQLNKQFGLAPTQVETIKLSEYKGRIPVVLEQMRKYLFANGGLQQEGIFRLAPDGDESTYVKQQLNENKFVKCNDVNCISNLLKVWFRDLPVHLLNDIKQESITGCDTEEQAGKIVNTELADPQQSIFLWLLDMCIEVAKYSGVNKMTPQNLAIVIGPNLFTPQMTDPMASLVFSQKVANFLHKSILWRKKTLGES